MKCCGRVVGSRQPSRIFPRLISGPGWLLTIQFPPTYPDEALSLAGGIVRPGANTPFPALDFDERLMPSVSPILHVSSDDPPTLLVHGDADTLVDVNNSRLMHTALSGKGVVTDLVIIEGAGHGFQGTDATRANAALVDWFSTYLAEGN